ncbi:hypothetical protein ACT4QJ_10235 [Elizabethkingia anophelis]|uniref:hypothetical protein n=1 Tax=Elizabethkingia TaxID=308865 RepID=UPI000B309FA5|nr:MULTISPECIES: hypothetical protein [Elizabethkingia]MDX8559025.1 hypothetical protein [Elizabethkingia sp. HX ZCH]MDX8579577.1 hypothetical protein [Elizabethkingia sp. HX YK]CAH1151668.1 hypothetical protein EAVNVH72_02104 [Elizabethkingia anophelis]CAI9679156.1 hypothetical protein EAVNVH72_00904 [Elizabethkingia anophelis]
MGNINNKAQISGAVGNVVFVSNGHKTIVRTKPGKVKQSKSTKAAAGFFGQISRQDSRYRKALLELLQLNTDTTYAYRHRASFGRVAVRYKENETEYMSLLKGSPQAMEGFDFNMQSPWLSLCRFFLKFDLSAQGDLRVKIPDVELGIQIKNDKKTTKATLRFSCISLNPDQDSYTDIHLLSDISIDLHPQIPVSFPEWIISDVPKNELVFIIAQLTRYQKIHQSEKIINSSSAYLWGGKRE